MEMVSHVINCIELAEQKQSKLTEEIANWHNGDGNEGMSSPKVRHLFNNLLDKDLCKKYGIFNRNYLEIGTWKGSTAVSALYKNSLDNYWLIDNYSQFAGGSFGNPYERLVDNFKVYLNSTPNTVQEDSFSVDCGSHNIQDINFYFYDGEHSEASQRNAITYYIDAMADEFVLIVDDYDGDNPKVGTMSALNQLVSENKIEIKYSRHLSTAGIVNYSHPDSWYVGIFIAVIKKIN